MPGSPDFTLDAALTDLLDKAERNSERFSTGYSIDDSCGRVGPGELALLWARSGSGKSTFFINVVSNTPKVPTLIFNLEMTSGQVMEWLCLMSFDLSVPHTEVDAVLRDKEHPAYEEVLSALRATIQKYDSVWAFQPDKPPSLTELAMKVDEVEDNTGVRPQRIFIDHLSLMQDARSYDNVSALGAALRAWAQKERLAVYVVQQTTRGGAGDGGRNDGHIPVTLSSGIFAGEQDADWIFGMYREDRNPLFRKQRYEFKKEDDYLDMLQRRAEVTCTARLQVIKNRPFGHEEHEGVLLNYWPANRRLTMAGRQ